MKGYTMRKASINFKKASLSNLEHNDRTESPEYVIDTPENNYYSNSAKDARMLFKQYYAEAKRNYLKTYHQKLQAKIYLWEAVVNLDEKHDRSDVQYLVDYLIEYTGFQLLQYAYHRDEGYINEEGAKVFNYHLHIIFFTLDLKTGKQLYRLTASKSDMKNEVKRPVMNKRGMSKLQDIVAGLLDMPRGKKGSKKVRLGHKAYRAKMKADTQTQKEIKELQDEMKNMELAISIYHSSMHQIRDIVNMRDARFAEVCDRLMYLVSLENLYKERIIDNQQVSGYVDSIKRKL